MNPARIAIDAGFGFPWVTAYADTLTVVSVAMKIVFAGTPEFALPALRAVLDSNHAVIAVYTQPDRPAGRGRTLRASPVKQIALAEGIRVCQPDSVDAVLLLNAPAMPGLFFAWRRRSR